MMPASGHDIDLQMDAVFNYRMTYLLLKTGTVPAVDPLSTYPEGKQVTALLPTGIYYACAAFRRGMDIFSSLRLTTIVLLFCSLCGSLIALPVYFISLELYHSRPIALASAALAGVIPGSLERTLCYWYRDEILAVPILFLSFLFFLKIFDSSGDRRAILNGSISMALLVAAFYVWRLCILFVAAYLVSLVYLAFRRTTSIRRVAIAGLLLLCFCGILLSFIPGFGMRNPESHYGGFPRAILEIGLNSLGVRTEFSDFTRLVSDNRELQSVDPREMIGWKMLSLSAIFPVIFLAMSFGRKERSAQRDVVCASVVLFGALASLVNRNVVFLAPFVALTAGESLSAAGDPRRKAAVRYGLLAVSLVIMAKTGLDGYRMASARHLDTRIGTHLTQALVKIRDLTPPGAAVSCYWAEGYMVQSYCDRPTLTDGLFESGEIVSRILEESKAYYSDDEGALWNYCVRHGAAYLLVPVYRTMSYAHQAGVDYGTYFGADGPTAAGKATVLFRLLHEPGSLKHFHELFRSPTYILYQVLRADSGPPGAAS
ncbi:MAG TPA: STT3 domain-containing protein [Patescibacteria group bacterium]|nr:STT3 domain-containing protein [Patescibacteria group bacterium]